MRGSFKEEAALEMGYIDFQKMRAFRTVERELVKTQGHGIISKKVDLNIGCIGY